MPEPIGPAAAVLRLGKIVAKVPVKEVVIGAAVVAIVVGAGYYIYRFFTGQKMVAPSRAISNRSNVDNDDIKVPRLSPAKLGESRSTIEDYKVSRPSSTNVDKDDNVSRPSSTVRQRKLPNKKGPVDTKNVGWNPHQSQRIINEDTKNFDKFQCFSKEGSGPYGSVYDARTDSQLRVSWLSDTSTSTSERIAVKITKARNAVVSPTYLEEVEILKSIKHKNIIKFYDVMEKGPRIAVLMEKYQKGNLKSLIELKVCTSTEFSRELVHCWMKSLSSAVEYLHSKNIFHRNLKLTNILVGGNDDLVITDVALSRVWNLSYSRTIPVAKNFLAPSTRNERYDAVDDIYSLGCIFICILAMVVDPRPDRRIWNIIKTFGVPHLSLIYQCVAVRRESRPTAQELKNELQGLQ